MYKIEGNTPHILVFYHMEHIFVKSILVQPSVLVHQIGRPNSLVHLIWSRKICFTKVGQHYFSAYVQKRCIFWENAICLQALTTYISRNCVNNGHHHFVERILILYNETCLSSWSTSPICELYSCITFEMGIWLCFFFFARVTFCLSQWFYSTVVSGKWYWFFIISF